MPVWNPRTQAEFVCLFFFSHLIRKIKELINRKKLVGWKNFPYKDGHANNEKGTKKHT